MQPADRIAEGERIFTICNACRYCEGYCPVFPALERRRRFSPTDLHYLANLCHQCGECFYACQYAPPHEFGVNVPETLSEIRIETYREYSGSRRIAVALGLILAAVAAEMLWIGPRSTTTGPFYQIVPYEGMATIFTAVSILVVSVMTISLVRFWQGPRPPLSALIPAVTDALTLRYLGSGGHGCPYPVDRHSQRRRYFHHCTFYGFFLCFAATTIAAFYHHVLNLEAPYAYFSLPVALGTLGGIGLLVGPAGLLLLKRRQDPATASPRMRILDVTFLVLLFLTSLTGLVLLAFRKTVAMPPLLYVHLGIVLALFVTMPYGKFIHGLYRFAALIRYAEERSSGSR